jgi:hypothetical protein
MASTISAGTTSGTAIAVAGDTSGVLQLQTNGTTTAVTINTSQNVGIGTTNPTNKFVVASSGAGYEIDQASIANTNLLLSYDRGASAYRAVANYYGGNYIWNDGGTERMRINSSGSLLIGCTAFPGSSVSGMGITGASSSNASSSGTSTSTYNHWLFYNGNGIVGNINTSGSATAYVTSSDYRLKENIAPMTGALAKIAQLKPVTYTWKSDGTESQGFIAHELQAVVPDCVIGEKDAVDADGNIKPQGVDTSFLVATLTAAIQELKTIVDTQATKIAELEAKLEGTE